MKNKFTPEEKLRIVQKYESGIGSVHLAREYKTCHHSILEWVAVYRKYGADGLKPREGCAHDEKTRHRAVLELEKGLTLQAVAIKYGVCRGTIMEWHRKYATHNEKEKRPASAISRRAENPAGGAGVSARRECTAKKTEGLGHGRIQKKKKDAAAIDELRPTHKLCSLLKSKNMARSTFYYHRNRAGIDKYADAKRLIQNVFDSHEGRYGSRRITLELRNLGMHLNHKTIEKLMRELGLRAVTHKARHYNSYKGTVGRIAPNIINRNFKASMPMEKLATDVTQVNINDKRLYISPVLDMFNGEIVCYSVSSSPDMKMIGEMLTKLFAVKGRAPHCILHSDQGWQYQHKAYSGALRSHNVTQSMSRKGNCLDNAMMENFFALMKNEMLYCNRYTSIADFEQNLHKYIHYYNNERLKLRLQGLAPVQYRLNYNREYKSV